MKIIEINDKNYKSLGMETINRLVLESYIGVEITNLGSKKYKIKYSDIILNGKRSVVGFQNFESIEYYYADAKTNDSKEIKITKINPKNAKSAIKEWISMGYDSICFEDFDGIVFSFDKELLYNLL